MKILIIDVNCKYSSTGNIVYAEYEYLKNHGHNVMVCYGRGPRINEEGIFKFGIDAETVLHAGLARITGYNGCFSPISTNRLIKVIKQFNPDVIHIHELHAYFVNIKPLMECIISVGIKTVLTLHCEYDYTGKCGYSNECMNFQSGCGNCPHLKDYPKSFFFDHTSEMLYMKRNLFSSINPVLTVPSQWMENRVKLSFMKDFKTYIVHNGLDTNLFTIRNSKDLIRKIHNIDDDKKILLGIAPDIMSDRKGGKWMLEIASQLKDRVHLILIGVESGVRAEDNLTIISKITDRNSLSEYYSAADVYILCSNRETFSMTCAEALSCGTPIVGFKAGAPETVFKEPYAVFTEYGDLYAITKAISVRLDSTINPDVIRKYAVSEFSSERMCRGYQNIFESLVEV